MTPPETCGWCGVECGRKFEAFRMMEVQLVTRGVRTDGSPDVQVEEYQPLREMKWFCTEEHRTEYCFGPDERKMIIKFLLRRSSGLSADRRETVRVLAADIRDGKHQVRT